MITVVTITYNNYEELVETLDSLQPALGDGIESLVINGGDCTRTREYLENYPGRSISEPDKGIADAFNKGIINAKGDYIAILNSGDLLTYPAYYREALKLINDNNQPAYIYGNALFKHGHLGAIEVKPQMELILRQMPFLHCTMVTKKELLIKFGMFNQEYKIAMDYDFLIKLYKNNYQGIYCNTDFAFLMDGSGVSSQNGLKGIEECMKTLRNSNLLTFKSWKYFTILKMKNYARKMISSVGMIDIYDRIRHGKKA